ncbi:MAG: uroporphyrinogen decarboxylase family protein [Eubacteriales bacterium]|jgi:uroporphyrinogen-III decarboxylase
MYFTKEQILAADLPRLKEMALATLESDENKQLLNNNNRVKLKFGIGRPLYANALGFKTMDYFTDPEVSVTAQLRWKLVVFHLLRDDTPFDLDIGIDYASALEPNMLGVEMIEGEGKEPSYGHPIIHEYDDLKKIPMPDFYKSGKMPHVHRMYEAFQEILGEPFRVFMPGWARGPWSIANMLRGFTECFMDSYDNPEFLHDLMQFAVDARISFEKQRCKFLGIDPTDHSYTWKYCVYRINHSSDCFEDEVDGALFGVPFYREFVLPYEKQLSQFYNGLDYYHSCGTMTPFLDDIGKELNVIGMQHVSAWTSLSKAAEAHKENVLLQYSLNALDDVFGSTPQQMEDRVRKLIEESGNHPLDVCADAIYNGSWPQLEQVMVFRDAFRRVNGQL